jgi:hypothetical protein
MFGFTESFNLSVATALLLQRMFDACPEARGDLPESEKAVIRASWFERLSRNPTAMAANEKFLECPDEIEPLRDLRRPEAERGSWAPPKIKTREAEFLAFSGVGGAGLGGTGVPRDGEPSKKRA